MTGDNFASLDYRQGVYNFAQTNVDNIRFQRNVNGGKALDEKLEIVDGDFDPIEFDRQYRADNLRKFEESKKQIEEDRQRSAAAFNAQMATLPNIQRPAQYPYPYGLPTVYGVAYGATPSTPLYYTQPDLYEYYEKLRAYSEEQRKQVLLEMLAGCKDKQRKLTEILKAIRQLEARHQAATAEAPAIVNPWSNIETPVPVRPTTPRDPNALDYAVGGAAVIGVAGALIGGAVAAFKSYRRNKTAPPAENMNSG